MLNINLGGRSLPLDDRLLNVLPEQIRGRAKKWTPWGQFDVDVRARDWALPEEVSAEALRKLAVSVQLRNLSFSHWGAFPACTQHLRASGVA